MYEWMKAGFTMVPNVLLQHYHALDLSPDTFLLVVSLLSESAPIGAMNLIEICQTYYQMSQESAMEAMARLSDQGYLVFETQVTEEGEEDVLSLAPLFKTLDQLAFPRMEESEQEDALASVSPSQEGADLVRLVESEFGRSLSALEYETLNNWLQLDQYEVGLIRLALREAVLRQALSLKYIDRILINWERQGIRTEIQAQAALQRFEQKTAANQEAIYDQIDIPLM